eukprot:8397297-Pyramimonas_sp.AAC.1
MPVDWEEDAIRERFEKYGPLEKVVLAKNMLKAKRKDFGFLTYETREAALAAIEVTTPSRPPLDPL